LKNQPDTDKVNLISKFLRNWWCHLGYPVRCDFLWFPLTIFAKLRVFLSTLFCHPYILLNFTVLQSSVFKLS